MRTGVHLANHGAKVVSYILTTQDHSELFKTNLRVFSSAGGRILRDIEGEFAISLIISPPCISLIHSGPLL